MELPALQPATLYLVDTPIRNLEEITLRALRVLRECNVVAAEDTRRTGLLLKHFGIPKPLLSYFQFNEAKRRQEILERLRRGEKVARVTDAGNVSIRLHGKGAQGAKPKGKALVDILAAIHERRAWDVGARLSPIYRGSRSTFLRRSASVLAAACRLASLRLVRRTQPRSATNAASSPS